MTSLRTSATRCGAFRNVRNTPYTHPRPASRYCYFARAHLTPPQDSSLGAMILSSSLIVSPRPRSTDLLEMQIDVRDALLEGRTTPRPRITVPEIVPATRRGRKPPRSVRKAPQRPVVGINVATDVADETAEASSAPRPQRRLRRRGAVAIETRVGQWKNWVQPEWINPYTSWKASFWEGNPFHSDSYWAHGLTAQATTAAKATASMVNFVPVYAGGMLRYLPLQAPGAHLSRHSNENIQPEMLRPAWQSPRSGRVEQSLRLCGGRSAADRSPRGVMVATPTWRAAPRHQAPTAQGEAADNCRGQQSSDRPRPPPARPALHTTGQLGASRGPRSARMLAEGRAQSVEESPLILLAEEVSPHGGHLERIRVARTSRATTRSLPEQGVHYTPAAAA